MYVLEAGTHLSRKKGWWEALHSASQHLGINSSLLRPYLSLDQEPRLSSITRGRCSSKSPADPSAHSSYTAPPAPTMTP